MAYEQRDNSGTLGRNNNRQKDTHPEYNGSAQIDGVDYWINAWVKEGPKGKFFSLSFKPKENRSSESKSYQRDDSGDDTPF